MKTSTVLQKIKKQYDDGEIDFDHLIEALSEACLQTIIKERKSLIRKFAKGYELDPEDVEKKILAKKNRHITEEKVLKYIDMFSQQPIIYQTLMKNGIEYLCEMSTFSLIYDINACDSDERVPKIVGYINSLKQPIFIRR
jgi:hypothetical protein